MSKKKVKSYDNELKARVVLEVLKEDRMVNEIASEYGILPRTIHYWKKEFLENKALIFSKEKTYGDYQYKLKQKELEIEELYKQIGKLNTQLEWAKKKSRELGINYPAFLD